MGIFQISRRTDYKIAIDKMSFYGLDNFLNSMKQNESSYITQFY
jgi:hypothetical protein